jgi:hypothetical protein
MRRSSTTRDLARLRISHIITTMLPIALSFMIVRDTPVRR